MRHPFNLYFFLHSVLTCALNCSTQSSPAPHCPQLSPFSPCTYLLAVLTCSTLYSSALPRPNLVQTGTPKSIPSSAALCPQLCHPVLIPLQPALNLFRLHLLLTSSIMQYLAPFRSHLFLSASHLAYSHLSSPHLLHHVIALYSPAVNRPHLVHHILNLINGGVVAHGFKHCTQFLEKVLTVFSYKNLFINILDLNIADLCVNCSVSIFVKNDKSVPGTRGLLMAVLGLVFFIYFFIFLLAKSRNIALINHPSQNIVCFKRKHQCFTHREGETADLTWHKMSCNTSCKERMAYQRLLSWELKSCLYSIRHKNCITLKNIAVF